MSGYRHNPDRLTSNSGFTLIEMLVAMVIAVIVMGGAVSMFRSNRIAYTLTNELRILEENSRIGIDYMGRALRGANFPGGVDPLFQVDNLGADPDNIRTNVDWKTGTDILELFTSSCPEEIRISFSETAANTQVPASSLIGCMECYDPSGSSQDLNDCLSQYVILIQGAGPNKMCTQNITGGNFTGGGANAKINYNRGSDDEVRNSPHDCADVTGHEINPNTGWANVVIGEDIYYYVRNDDPDNPDPTKPNPQLMRYNFGGNTEVIANNVEDFQVVIGEDSDANGTVDLWGDEVTTGENVRTARISMLFRSDNIDPNKAVKLVPPLENSDIDSTGTSDKYLRRVASRTVRLRNMGN